MSQKEQAIAEAALRPYAGATYDEVYAEIAAYTGDSVDEVEQIIDELVDDFTLTDKHLAMLNPIPQVEGDVKIVQSWWEKGRHWGEPRMTLHS